MQPRETDAFLVIPDITGYTRFTQLPHTTLEHSQRGVTGLLESLHRAVGHDLVVSKIEGDAILFYREVPPEGSEAKEGRRLGRCITRMIRAFYDARDQLAQELAPLCHACGELKELDLKIVVHRGRILIHEVMARQEISGPAVIVAHRLLSAASDAPSRIVVTDQAAIDIELPFPADSHPAVATVDGVGPIGFRVSAFDPALIATEQAREGNSIKDAPN